MALKYGQVCEISGTEKIVYYDGSCQRELSIDVLRSFLGDQVKEVQALLGHCIQVLKDRSGRITRIQILD